MGDRDNPRIVLVDDDPTWLRALARLLRQAGAEVDTLERPDDALARLEDGVPDLFVLDYDLGAHGTGAGLAARLREALRSSCPPLALLTAQLASVPDRELGSFDLARSKDTDPAALVDALVALATQRPGSRSGFLRAADDGGGGERASG